jgi:hypothetical protein
MKKMTPKQQKEAEEYAKKRGEDRSIFLQELANHKDKFKKYYFERHNRLVLVFESFPLDCVRNNFSSTGCAGCTKYKDEVKPKIEISFYFSFPKDKVDEWVVANREFHNEMCSILGIKPTKKDREEAQKKERKRLTKIGDFFEAKAKANSPILFTDIVNQAIISVTPGEIFDGVRFVENPGQGYYHLHYFDNQVKTIFYNDGSQEIHGAKFSHGTCYESIQDRNRAFNKYHKKNTLLNGRLLVFSNKIMFEYFHHLMRIHYNVLFSYEPKIEEAFNLGKPDYTDTFRVYRFKHVKKGFEQVVEISKIPSLSELLCKATKDNIHDETDTREAVGREAW